VIWQAILVRRRIWPWSGNGRFLELFVQPNVPDVRAHLLAQDVIFASGGSLVNQLAVWRAHRAGCRGKGSKPAFALHGRNLLTNLYFFYGIEYQER
jgi:hypothetical protein